LPLLISLFRLLGIGLLSGGEKEKQKMITTGGGGGSHESGGPEDTDIDVAFNLRTPNSGVNILNTIGMKGAVNPIIVGEGLESNPIPRRRNSEINNGMYFLFKIYLCFLYLMLLCLN
jgi:hypothetical protein